MTVLRQVQGLVAVVEWIQRQLRSTHFDVFKTFLDKSHRTRRQSFDGKRPHQKPANRSHRVRMNQVLLALSMHAHCLSLFLPYLIGFARTVVVGIVVMITFFLFLGLIRSELLSSLFNLYYLITTAQFLLTVIGCQPLGICYGAVSIFLLSVQELSSWFVVSYVHGIWRRENQMEVFDIPPDGTVAVTIEAKIGEYQKVSFRVRSCLTIVLLTFVFA